LRRKSSLSLSVIFLYKVGTGFPFAFGFGFAEDGEELAWGDGFAGEAVVDFGFGGAETLVEELDLLDGGCCVGEVAEDLAVSDCGKWMELGVEGHFEGFVSISSNMFSWPSRMSGQIAWAAVIYSSAVIGWMSLITIRRWLRQVSCSSSSRRR